MPASRGCPFASRAKHLSLDISNAALAGRYDAVPYAALPHAQTHPDRLATVATFLGMRPPAVADCRVLEVGCSDGANLIPMALGLPQARFVGCDLSPRALGAGRDMVAALGLANIELVEADLAGLDPALGSFDYIVAHGVYSWVPPAVRDGLFALAQDRLAPNGVLFVSYNALPGSAVRRTAWDVLHRVVDAIAEPRERMEAARRFARAVADAAKSPHEGDEALRAEFRALAQRSDSALFHDDLALPNEPFYLAQVLDHAARFGLSFLGEADVHAMSAAGIAPEMRALLSSLDVPAREQHLDFLRLRRFRQTLLRRSDAAVDRASLPERFDAMHMAADASLLRAAAAGKVGDLAQGLDPAGGGDGAVRALLDALVAMSPATVALADVPALLRGASLPNSLAALVTDAYVSSVVRLHVQPPFLTAVAGERPHASALARVQARSHEDVTGLLHARVRLPDANVRHLLTLLDGTRDRGALNAAMAASGSGLDAASAPRFVAHSVEQFARLALLVA